MSEKVRRHFSADSAPDGCHDMLQAIFEHYNDNTVFDGERERVRLATLVAREISKHAPRSWGWRYIVSVRNGTISPSRFLKDAITLTYEHIQGLPPKVLATACTDCGGTPTVCLCGDKRVVKKRRKRPPRDLFATPKKDLLWALENREVLDE